MAAQDRSESVLIVTLPGRSFKHNVQLWEEWATGLWSTVCTSDKLLEELAFHEEHGSTHVWLADASYTPLPTAFRKLLEKQVWDESVYTLFRTSRPTFMRAFYSEKLTSDYDRHDKFGGLRYVRLDALLEEEGFILDELCLGRPVDYVEHMATKLSFPYSVFHLSSNEPQNVVLAGLESIRRFYPSVIPHYGEGTILQSHKEIAAKSDSEMFLVMDADFVLEKGLGLESFQKWDENSVHVWYARNPINGLIYGHGGPKAFNQKSFQKMGNSTIDVTTTSNKGVLTIHTECVGVHRFNWSGESTFRTAFRECAKLTWQIDSDHEWSAEAKERLDIWLSEELVEESEMYIEECLDGAKLGHEWAAICDKSERVYINDFKWLREQYDLYVKMIAESNEALDDMDEIELDDDDDSQ